MKNSILWNPKDSIYNTQMYEFMSLISGRYKESFEDYFSFHKWSVENLREFWKEFFDFAEFQYSGNKEIVFREAESFQDTVWFPEIQLNFAENILYPVLESSKLENSKPFIYSIVEEKEIRLVYAKEILQKVSQLQTALLQMGVKKGDRICACMPNIPETIFIMLATTSIGAIFSSGSPDFGENAIVDRFGQISPKVYFCTDSYFYKGKKISKEAEHSKIVSRIPSIEKIVVYSTEKNQFSIPNSISFGDFISPTSEEDLQFTRLGFSDPVYIMYSSGTTGLPKCMAQGFGVLLNHKKEHLLHLDLRSKEKLFYFTTCGWMMWNWLVSAISTGASIVLFDGNPLYPSPARLWEIARDLEIEVFGTSAGYLSALEKSGTIINKNFQFPKLRTILSTGSPLLPEQFDFVYSTISDSVQLSSISGGTDLNGCFVLGNPILPVSRGEIQCKGLGMDVEIWNEKGESVKEEEGELVCKKPFPSMPLFFWKDEGGEKYKNAYFSQFPNAWRHGDFAIAKESGGFVIQGRSDATLNPGGVRIGTAEIYRVVEKIHFIQDSLAVGQKQGSSERVILFVKLKESTEWNEKLESIIRSELKEKASPRHVPEFIFVVPEIPYTRNMKKVELAIKNILDGKVVTNRESLLNPECLGFYEKLRNQF
jgi:acetoacetyl-CoA synthetase